MFYLLSLYLKIPIKNITAFKKHDIISEKGHFVVYFICNTFKWELNCSTRPMIQSLIRVLDVFLSKNNMHVNFFLIIYIIKIF